MKNNLLLFTITLLFLGLSACQKDSTDLSETSNTPAADRNPDTPFKAAYETTFQVVGVNNGVLALVINGKGKGTHLGKSTWYADSWVDTNQFPFLQTGDMEFTAANGAKLYGSFSGIATPDGQGKINFEGTYQITGGTGRFEGAMGSGEYSGYAIDAEGTGYLEFDGTLSNP